MKKRVYFRGPESDGSYQPIHLCGKWWYDPNMTWQSDESYCPLEVEEPDCTLPDWLIVEVPEEVLDKVKILMLKGEIK